ncbi:hypothetical protein [Mycobacterium sp. 360MFTsu5.1]|uniref:hypothetical protein n=1 Tax=Mycobacterium sp. 360MFTsu5.1 TaxID=1172186 RepID=UPI0012DC5CAF|nr:hypothetical protein [Mycobacterium sp. 360MFTsu5.1]
MDDVPFTDIVQAYLFSSHGWSQRVRFSRFAGMESVSAEVLATYALKGPQTSKGRVEYDWEIDLDVAIAVSAITDVKVRKLRHHLVAEGEAYDVDVFLGRNRGLVVAELESSDPYKAHTASFCSIEVTQDVRFQNDQLASNPFVEWPEEDRQRFCVDVPGKSSQMPDVG